MWGTALTIIGPGANCVGTVKVLVDLGVTILVVSQYTIGIVLLFKEGNLVFNLRSNYNIS